MKTEYLAVASGSVYLYGEWVRGSDVNQLLKRLKNIIGVETIVARVYETDSDREKVWVDDFGRTWWDEGYRPKAVGIFCIEKKNNRNVISTVQRGQFNADHKSSEEWVEAFNNPHDEE